MFLKCSFPYIIILFVMISISVRCFNIPIIFNEKAVRDIQRYSSTGAGHRITNSLCGPQLLTRSHRNVIEDNTCDKASWKLFRRSNKNLCECNKLGSITSKYAYIWLLLMRHHRELVFSGPEETMNAIRDNKTLHFLYDHGIQLFYHEGNRNNRFLSFYSTSSHTAVGRHNNVTVTLCQHVLSRITHIMQSNDVSFMMININTSTNIVEKVAADLMQGISGFYVSSFFENVNKGHLHVNVFNGLGNYHNF